MCKQVQVGSYIFPIHALELLARSKGNTWKLSDCNKIRTDNHLVCKQTLNNFVKLAKWLRVHLQI